LLSAKTSSALQQYFPVTVPEKTQCWKVDVLTGHIRKRGTKLIPTQRNTLINPEYGTH